MTAKQILECWEYLCANEESGYNRDHPGRIMRTEERMLEELNVAIQTEGGGYGRWPSWRALAADYLGRRLS